MQKKDIVKISITGVLIFILLFTGINIMKKTKKSKHLENKVAKTSVYARDLFKMQEEESRNLELERDPFAVGSITSSETSSSEIQLNGILWDKSGSLAIINHTIVKIGDKIGENTLVDIKEDGIILNDGSHDFELKLGR